jgi:hypothetical protein
MRKKGQLRHPGSTGYRRVGGQGQRTDAIVRLSICIYRYAGNDGDEIPLLFQTVC